MKLFFQPEISEGIHHLDKEESWHCIKVIRKMKGDHIHIIDGKGSYFEVEIVTADKLRCEFRVISQNEEAPKGYHINVAIAPTKSSDRMEWFAEKCTEIGIDQISLIRCQHSERNKMPTDRLEKKLISATKQCGRATIPTLSPMVPFNQFIEQSDQNAFRCIAHIDEKMPVSLQKIAPPGNQYQILIGPEGGFSPQELIFARQQGFKPVHLGPHKLRTETAGIAACHIFNLINQ